MNSIESAIRRIIGEVEIAKATKKPHFETPLATYGPMTDPDFNEVQQRLGTMGYVVESK